MPRDTPQKALFEFVRCPECHKKFYRYRERFKNWKCQACGTVFMVDLEKQTVETVQTVIPFPHKRKG